MNEEIAKGFTKEDIENIQKMNVFKEEWNTAMLNVMTDDQIIKCHHYIYRRLMEGIRELRGETNIFDIATNDLVAKLLEETQKRIGGKYNENEKEKDKGDS